ncbi:hypothetical protein G3578_17815 [Brevibacillus sp. SYP-B805]|uniref:hypothetical protein n=1 Tax=Brevibacillus sp. SYP-B805 TaxID=1578199 RepID=UPI0013ED7DDD|nr:hypothetical protein [Brevibacillus sp. SYP-B805]NGQ97023.1 hypothetical protein [Brevibacillus sp. SYP-B805]
MNGNFVQDLLEKLKQKTGREWSMADLMRLAQKLPELNGNNVEAVLTELQEMGLELPEEIKEKVRGKLAEDGYDQRQAAQAIQELADETKKSSSKKRRATGKKSRKK